MRHHAFSLFAAFLLASSSPALAQRVVVLDFEGDRNDKLRAQVEAAVDEAGELQRVPLQDYRAAAAARGLKGDRSMQPAAVGQLGRGLRLSAALGGVVGSDFAVRILDASGTELWGKELPLKKGKLSDDHARKLARALSAAARSAQATQASGPQAADAPTGGQGGEGEMGLDLTGGEPVAVTPDTRQDRREPVGARDEPPPSDSPQRPSSRSSRTAVKVGPKLLQVQLLGSATWRSYCAYPGVAACAEFAGLPEADRPVGVSIDFSTLVPYAGGAVGVELFPLARVVDGPLAGLGLTGSYGLGYSLINIRTESAVDSAPVQQVTALDHAYQAFATWRWHFGLGGEAGAPNVGHVGLRGGLQGRNFEVDLSANSVLPGSSRLFGAVGAEASIPLARFLKIDVGGSYLLGAEPSVNELIAFGERVQTAGFSAEAGLSGELVGPLGYLVRVRYLRFADTFTGAGQKWESGGAAEESFLTAHAGATLSF
ncbi:MAG: hypothetical protein RL653_1280 [Pseudomonadota bacterium]|jgi:hypothetical protein